MNVPVQLCSKMLGVNYVFLGPPSGLLLVSNSSVDILYQDQASHLTSGYFTLVTEDATQLVILFGRIIFPKLMVLTSQLIYQPHLQECNLLT